MSAFRDRLNNLRPNPTNTLSPDYKKAIWHVLIGAGGVGDTSYNRWGDTGIKAAYSTYSNGLRFDYEASLKAYEQIQQHGINYEQSDDPAPHTDYGFLGTFTDSESTDYYCGGKLVLNNGEEILWGLNLPGEGSFRSLLTAAVLEFTLEEALDGLLERLTHKDYGSYLFSHSCKLNWRNE